METYNIEGIIGGIGYLRGAEELAIREVLGHNASVSYDQICHRVHLSWNTHADSLDDAITVSRSTLRDAACATGTFIPCTEFFSVRRVGQ